MTTWNKDKKTDDTMTTWNKDKKTDDTMTTWNKDKRQTIQWPHEKRTKDRRYNDHVKWRQKTDDAMTTWNKDKKTDDTLTTWNKDKKTNNDLQRNSQKTKDRATRTPLKTWWGWVECFVLKILILFTLFWKSQLQNE